MNNPRHPVNSTSYSRGFTYRQVTVKAIDSNGAAHCSDGAGNIMVVPTNIMKAKGEFPKVGDKWAVSKELGKWSFAAILNLAPTSGMATILNAASTVAVTFDVPEPDALYGVLITPSYNAHCWFASRTVNGFTIHASTAASGDSPVAWKLVR